MNIKNVINGSIVSVLLLCFVCLITSSIAQSKKMVVVIDAGHGGKDPGCLGSKHFEKDVALSVALKLGGLIEKNCSDVKVLYTRKKDVFVELEERANIANRNKADFFISIHCNSSQSKSTSGSETYVMGTHKNQENLDVAMRENSAILQEDSYEKYHFDPMNMVSYIRMANFQNTYQVRSMDFAVGVEKQFQALTKRSSRGVKQSGFLVLWRTSMPSALIEIGFLTNKNEELFLGSGEGQQKIAQSIYNAFKSYKKSEGF